MLKAIALAAALSFAIATPCAQEDSANCLWDGDKRGNQTGLSFVDLNGTAIYLP